MRVTAFHLCVFALFAAVRAGDVKLSWQANGESDLAGYRVHHGTSSRDYAHTLDVGLQTEALLRGLADNVELFFAVTAYDTAGNESPFSQEISGVLGDTTPLRPLRVDVLSRTDLRIVFNKKLDRYSAERPEHYRIEGNVEIRSVFLEDDFCCVRLLTGAHQPGTNYTLILGGVADIAVPPNVIPQDTRLDYALSAPAGDTVPPTLTLAQLASPQTLEIHFSEPVDPLSAAEKGNYSIEPGIEIQAVKQIAPSLVELQTSAHQAGVVYTLTVSGLRDTSAAGNTIPPNSTYQYRLAAGDLNSPTVTLVKSVAVDRLEILFSEPLERSSAEQSGHYSISGGIEVLAARLHASGRIVTLETSAHEPNRLYLLSVHGIADSSANGNTVDPSARYAYVYEPADQVGPVLKRVQILDPTHLSVTFNEPVDPVSASVAENYRINNNVQVLDAKMDQSTGSVRLQTTPHSAGGIYILLVSHVRDLSEAGNEIAPNSAYTYSLADSEIGAAPMIVEAQPQNSTSLTVLFSTALDPISALEVSNYHLSSGVTVISASLSGDYTAVNLTTTEHEPNRLYILTVNNVKGSGPDGAPMAANSAYSYTFVGDDQLGPVITMVKCLDREHVDVLFNESLAASGAVEADNYSISGGIGVLSASLDASHRVVHLTTTPHQPDRIYLLRVSLVTDRSERGNPIDPAHAYAYLYEPADDLPPTLMQVRVLDARHLELVFSEALQPGSAVSKERYQIGPTVRIDSVKMGRDDNLVQLTVSALEPGIAYILLVNGILDLSGNSVPNNSSYTFFYGERLAPILLAAELQDLGNLLLTFDSVLDPGSAQRAGSYSISGGIEVLKAELDETGRRVTLHTTPHQWGMVYVLLLSGIGRRDDPAAAIRPQTPYVYLPGRGAGEPPRLEEVSPENATLVRLQFSDPLDALSAERPGNYRISNNVVVFSARCEGDGTTVYLETSAHVPGTAYLLEVSGAVRRDDRVEVVALSAYTFLPSLEVMIECSGEAQLNTLDVGRLYYLDRNYKITQMPDELRHLRAVLTANNDRERTDSEFLRIHLSQPACLYVAYDSRADSPPYWLTSRFERTSLSLGVNESAGQLDLWKAHFPSGVAELGGNSAGGARGAGCMYVVLIQEAALPAPPGGQLEGSSAPIPRSTRLHQNFPNPFNPFTTIAIELADERHLSLIVYDILGREVRRLHEGRAGPGRIDLVWDSRDELDRAMPSGLYFCRMEVWRYGSFNGVTFRENVETAVKKMVLVK